MKKLLPAAVVVGVAITLAACSADTAPDDPTNSIEVNAEARDLLPQAILDSGQLRIGLDVSSNYPPYASFDDDGSKPIGVDVDLTTAIAARLGLEGVVVDIAFDNLVPSLDSGRIDVAASALGDTEARQEKIDFVDYALAGAGYITLADNSQATPDETSLCGLRVATFPGSAHFDSVTSLSADCVSTGGTAIEQSTFGSASDAILALRSGRVDVMMGDYVPLQVSVGNADASDLKVVALDDSDLFRAVLLGIGIAKSQPELRDAVLLVAQEMDENGDLQNLLDEWSIGDTAIEQVSLNDARR